MSDLRKLLDEGDEFERSLLDAGIDPDEDRAREERTLAALGLGGPIGPGPGDGGATGAGGGAALGKWLAFAAAGGVIVAGAIAFRPKATPNPVPASPPALEAPIVIASVVPQPKAAPSASEAPPIASAPRVVVSKIAPSASAPPPQASDSSLKAEILALDRARAALKGGDLTRARAELDRYDREFPFGSLGPEAKALRARMNKIDGDRKKP
jgi:hypothetical protein